MRKLESVTFEDERGCSLRAHEDTLQGVFGLAFHQYETYGSMMVFAGAKGNIFAETPGGLLRPKIGRAGLTITPCTPIMQQLAGWLL